MSHFTLLVKIKKENCQNGNIINAITDMLAPFEESTKDEKFLDFKEVDESNITVYNEEYLSEGEGVDYSFEDYMYDLGYKKHPKTGKYGYTYNPNAKWDWYKIGGRWTGFFPLTSCAKKTCGSPGLMTPSCKEHRGDICQVKDIDVDKVLQEQQKRLNEFWEQWEQYKKGVIQHKPFKGPRYTALKLGLIEVKDLKDLSIKEKSLAHRWGDDPNCRADVKDQCDVCSDISLSDFTKKYRSYFNPISTFAYLDKDGWVEPGEMGWWGVSSDTPESLIKYHDEFWSRAIESSDPEDWLVLVDCHI